MKGILYFFGACLLAGLVLSFTFSKLPVLPMSGKALLTMFEQKQYAQAYGFFSQDFQKQTPLPIFTQMVEQSGLTNYKDVEWLKNIEDKEHKRGLLAGMVKTKQNTTIYIEMDFIESPNPTWGGTAWLVQDLRVKHAPDKPNINRP